MTIDKGIQIKNIYYMLAYAYRCLFQDGFKEVETEPFDNLEDLLASILIHGTNIQIKRGLFRDYTPIQESRKSVRGRIVLLPSFIEHEEKKDAITCRFDELSVDNRINQILKLTFLILAKSQRVKKENKTSIHKSLIFLQDVRTISLSEINWSVIGINRNNENYMMLLNICRLVIDSYLPTTEKGKMKMWRFSDQKMEMLYQHFILEYFRFHHSNFLTVNPDAIDWCLDDSADSNPYSLLPKMQTDVTLSSKTGDKTLIIDAKYYGNMLQEFHGKNSIISGHLYQIFAYVKNYKQDQSKSVSGMLLYAETSLNGPVDVKYKISGNEIAVKSLNLNEDFHSIAKALDHIAEVFFGPHEILHKINY